VSSLTRFSYINWTIFAFLCLENILRFALFKGVSYHKTLSFEDKVLYHIRVLIQIHNLQTMRTHACLWIYIYIIHITDIGVYVDLIICHSLSWLFAICQSCCCTLSADKVSLRVPDSLYFFI